MIVAADGEPPLVAEWTRQFAVSLRERYRLTAAVKLLVYAAHALAVHVVVCLLNGINSRQN